MLPFKLGRLDRELQARGFAHEEALSKERPHYRRLVKRIVLTGGPGAGKSTAVRLLADDDAWSEWRDGLGGVTSVTEAATAVYGSRGVRWDQIDDATRREVQREIYRRQIAGEAEAMTGVAAVLLDRGTIDGSAYWPDGAEAYWQDIGSTPDAELARYDAVLLLETSAAIGCYDGDATNAVRFESPEAAIQSGQKLRRLWSRHPRCIDVPATGSFETKLADVARRVTAIVRDDVDNAL